MIRPITATDLASDPWLVVLVLARARCPQIIDGTAVSPNVRRANTPSVNAQMGRAGSSSSKGGDVPEVRRESIIAAMTHVASEFARNVSQRNCAQLPCEFVSFSVKTS